MKKSDPSYQIVDIAEAQKKDLPEFKKHWRRELVDAIKNNNYAEVKKIIDMYPDIVNAYDKDRLGGGGHGNEEYLFLPIHVAAANGNSPEILKLLIEKGPNTINGITGDDINDRLPSRSARSPLRLAVDDDMWDKAKILIDNGADIRIKDKKGKTVFDILVDRIESCGKR